MARRAGEKNLAEGCLACEVTSGTVPTPGGVILDEGTWLVDHATSPVLLPGFLIAKPKRHVEHVGELTRDEAAALGPLLRDTALAMKKALGAKKVYVCSFGEGVRHVHFYLVPRFEGMPADGLEVIRAMFEEKLWATSDDDGARAAEKVRRELRTLRGG